MKNLLYSFSLLVILFGCEEFEDDKLDFSNDYPIYVEFNSGSDLEIKEGTSSTIRVQLRERVYNDIKVDYSMSGDITATGSVIIPEGSLGTDIVVEAPPDSAGSTAEISISAVDNGLAIGRDGTKTTKTILIVE